jgi:hypothetical protein
MTYKNIQTVTEKLKMFIDSILGFELLRVHFYTLTSVGVDILHSPRLDGRKLIHWHLYVYTPMIKSIGPAYYKRPIRMTNRW